MDKRERVMKGLECIICPNKFCGDCSYFIPNENDPDTGWCDRNAIYKDALALLKAQDSGAMTLEQVAEYHGLTPEGVDYALRQYQIIISEITHGMLSKLSYDGHDVLKCAQERWCDTCELKEAQEPKLVPDIAEATIGYKPKVKVGHCPSCGVLMSEMDKFCRKCGQAVKWDG